MQRGVHRQEMMWGNKKLSLETGKIARQALAAVMVAYEETMVLCTVTASKEPMEGVDFLPLSVHYQEKASAAGKIPGGFLKRESKPSDGEVLTSRFIDRGLRPLFFHDFTHEVQVCCTVLSYDNTADPSIAAMIGAAAALRLSGIPIRGTLGAVRLGYENGEFFVNPAPTQKTDLDMVFAATEDAVIMVEAEANELSELVMMEAFKYATTEILSVIHFMNSFADKVHVPTWVKAPVGYDHEECFARVKELASAGLSTLCSEKNASLREENLKNLKKHVMAELEEEKFPSHAISSIFKSTWRDIVRSSIIKNKRRLDGREYQEVRPIACEAALLPRTHGSALFTRGETQALVSVTLGGKEDAQLVDNLNGSYRDGFLLHYNFPPFSVGEVGRVGAPGRREMGHGWLACRALKVVLPKNLPYTVRVLSDITESNGSSSMATVCGGSIALMDAGIALTRPVAGIAMGLVHMKDNYSILSDLSGLEDAIGDMDCKIAGTERGITALQMDLKTAALPTEVMEHILEQARVGRLHILECMEQQGVNKKRATMSPYAPSMETIRIPQEKIRDLIGPGGKNIKQLCEDYSCKIDVAENGTVTIMAPNKELSKKAVDHVNKLTGSPVMGDVYDGVVVKIMPFGAFINFGFSEDGLVHISEISVQRLESVEQELSVGQKVLVRFIGLDPKGRTKLSIRQAL